MKRLTGQLIATVIFISGTLGAMATEEAKYKLVEKSGSFEIRDYECQLLVETVRDRRAHLGPLQPSFHPVVSTAK